VDSFIVAGSNQPFSLAQAFEKAQVAMKTPMANDLNLNRPEDLLGFALAGTQSAQNWVETAAQPTTLSNTGHLSSQIFAAPILHLVGLAPFITSVDQVWHIPSQPVQPVIDRLNQAMKARATFLSLLDDAVAGDMSSAFAGVKDLLDQDAELGTRALDSVIQPHVESALSALKRARSEGIASKAWEDASRSATTARMMSPKSPTPLLILAEISLEQGNLQSAKEHFEAVLVLEDSNAQARWGLARIARLRKAPMEAEKYLREVLRYHPQSWRARHNLGVFLQEQNRLDAAEKSLRQAASLAGGEEAAPHMALAELYLQDDRPTRALVEAERATQLDGGAMAWYLHGRAHFALENFDRAEDDFRRAVLADPAHAEARGGIGHIRALQKDWKAAADAFRSVLSLDPNNVAARENLREVEKELLETNDEASSSPDQTR